MNNQKKDYDNRQDYLWIGSSGEVLKGLDLFLDALCDKQYRLHVVGNVSQEFKEILEGKYDNLPEEAFRLVGGIEDVVEKAKKLAGNN